jgi:hypothetical protein
LQIQEILESNDLGAQVSYLEREDNTSPDNYIIYYRLSPNSTLYSDDKIHIRKVLVSIIHYHKKKLDSIADLMAKYFNVEAIQYDTLQLDTDYYGTYYKVEVMTDSRW